MREINLGTSADRFNRGVSPLIGGVRLIQVSLYYKEEKEK